MHERRRLVLRLVEEGAQGLLDHGLAPGDLVEELRDERCGTGNDAKGREKDSEGGAAGWVGSVGA
jgi:hypothetical protein